MPIQKLSRLAVFALAGTLAPVMGHAQEPSGKAVSVIPDAEALRTAAQVRILMPDQPVFMGDRVKTGPRGEAQLLFSDETRLVVGPESTLLVERYLLKGENTVSNFTVNALRGSFRFITGDSPKNAYAIKTPTATIGVRGTQFDLAIGANGETHLVLFEGSADVCSGGSCVRASDSCSMIEVSPGSRPQAVQDVAQRTQTLRDLFPYVEERANVLRADFQVDARACGLVPQQIIEPTQPPPPLVVPIVVPPAPPPPPPLLPAAAPPPPPPSPPPPVKPPKEKPPKHEHVEHRPHPKPEVKDDKHRHGPRRDGYEKPSARHGFTEHHRGTDGRRGSRSRDRDRDRDQFAGRRAVEQNDRPNYARHAGGGIDWSGHVRHDERTGGRGRGIDRDSGARGRDDRDHDGRERAGRDRDGREREARNRETFDRSRDNGHGRADFARHAGGGIDWSSSPQPAGSESRGRDGRDGRDRNGRDRDGRDDRRDGDRNGLSAQAVADSRGSDNRDHRSGGDGSRGDAGQGSGGGQGGGGNAGGGHGGGGQGGGGNAGAGSSGGSASAGGTSGGSAPGGGRDSEARSDGGRGEGGRGEGGRGEGGRGDGGRGEGGRGDGGRGDGGRGNGGHGDGNRGEGRGGRD